MADPRMEPVAPAVEDQADQMVQERMLDFLNTFGADDPEGAAYVEEVRRMQQFEDYVLNVNMDHLIGADPELAEAVTDEFYRYEPALRRAVQDFVRSHAPEHVSDERGDREFFVGMHGMPLTKRLRDLRTEQVGRLTAIAGTVTRTSEVRPELLYGAFNCLSCGALVESVEQQFKYTEPLVCPNQVCGGGGGGGGGRGRGGRGGGGGGGGGGDGPDGGGGGGGGARGGRRGAAATGSGQWTLDTEKSKFVDWQRLRVQENPDEIPAGCMPTSLDVIVRHSSVEKAKAGDKMVFTGSLIVLPDVSQLSRVGEAAQSMRGRGGGQFSGEGVRGLKALGVRDLTYKLAFLATAVQSVATTRGGGANIRADPNDAAEAAAALELEPDERAELLQMEADQHLYQNLVRSICPRVFGHSEIKRGVLLMLTGGVHKTTGEGINLRGDINVCIVGDPSTAKSQFLKYVHGFLPRAVYTSGKASSAAGLTASVAKDPDTGEFCVEAGALMLADNGICCIDEFEKMESADQVAIHEAMEQQTISITKAGIQATLNARTSILAAANPLHGRYDRSKPLASNVIIPPPVMSRFDLFFVVVDDCDRDGDRNVASHILAQHRANMSSGEEVIAEPPPYSQEQLQRYIRFARSYNPVITPEARRVLVTCYRELRAGDVAAHGGRSAYRITVRQLESMIRLSEALARLHLSDEVLPEYVLEAYRLLRASIIHVESDGVTLADPSAGGGGGGGGGDDDDDGPPEEFDMGEAPEGPTEEELEALEEAMGIESGGEGPAPAPAPAPAAPAADEPAPAAAPAAKPKKAKLQISYEKYQRIQVSVVSYMRRHEGPEGVSQRQGDVVAWYLGEQDDIAGADELALERTLVNRVVGRLVTKDNVLVYTDPDAREQPEEERQIAVHPNFGGE